MSGPTASAAGLRAEGLRLTYRARGPRGPRGGRVVALDGVDLRVGPSETVAVVGRSGSGKSSLVQVLLGLRAPDTGVVSWDGREESARRSRDFRRAVQYVAQDPASSLDPRWRVRDLVADPLHRLRVDGDPAARVHACLDAVGLDPDLAGRRPAQLSGGQAQRVALARAIAPRPRLLLADEPTSGLDPARREQVLDLLVTLADEHGLGVLLVSHDLDAVARLCARTVVVDAGRVVEERATADLLTDPHHDVSRALVAARPRLPERRR